MLKLKNLVEKGRNEFWIRFRDKERLKHELTYLFWEATLNCNFYCKHCGSKAGRRVFKNELATKEIKKTFLEISEDFDTKKITIAVTGGEPLLRKDIFEVMGYAYDLGFSWGMVTNGSLVNKGIVDKMKDAGMKSVVVSIDGLEKTHDQFRNFNGSYQKALNAVKMLSEGKFLTWNQITTTVHSGNIDELEEMHEIFTKTGINSWRVMKVDPIGRAELDKKILLNNKQLKELLDFIKEKRRKSKIDITYGCDGYLGQEYEGLVRNNLFFCLTGINIGSILHNGDIFVCPNVPRRKELMQGNIRKDRFSDVWNNKFQIFRDKDRTWCEKCSKCQFWEQCLGGSFHLWDFERREPKMCHLEFIKN